MRPLVIVPGPVIVLSLSRDLRTIELDFARAAPNSPLQGSTCPPYKVGTCVAAFPRYVSFFELRSPSFASGQLLVWACPDRREINGELESRPEAMLNRLDRRA